MWITYFIRFGVNLWIIPIYISERTKSKSVKDKLINNILTLYDRTSTAVHKDVMRGEARALILQLYVTLGEILTLGNIPKPTPQKNNGVNDPGKSAGPSQQEPEKQYEKQIDQKMEAKEQIVEKE